MNAATKTLLLLLVVIAGTIVATISHYWTPSFWTSFAQVAAPIPVGYACGRITADAVVRAVRTPRAG